MAPPCDLQSERYFWRTPHNFSGWGDSGLCVHTHVAANWRNREKSGGEKILWTRDEIPCANTAGCESVDGHRAKVTIEQRSYEVSLA
jgi:hypothetical protein